MATKPKPVPTEVSYRLTCSMLHVSGTRETRTDWEAESETTVSEATLQMAHAAERRGYVRLPKFDASHDFEVKLTPDGRLAAASNSSQALLGDVIEASLGVASLAVGIVRAIAAPSLPGVRGVGQPEAASRAVGAPATKEGEDPKTPAARWLKEDPDGDATLLKAAVETLRSLNKALVTTAAQAGETESPAGLFRRLMAIRVAIGEVEDQIAAVNARRDAWHAANYVASKDYEFDFPTDALFKMPVESFVAPAELPRDQLKGGAQTAHAVYDRLGVAFVELLHPHIRDRATNADVEDQVQLDADSLYGDLAPGIWFRMPRSALIAVYAAEDAGGPLKLQDADFHWVLDKYSQLGSFPLEGGGSLDVAASFAADGQLHSLSMDASSKLQAVLEAIKAAPGQVSAGLEHAEKIVASWDKLGATRADRELKALENRKKQLEAEIANRGLESDAAKTETLQQIKDRLARLKVERAIGKIEHPAPAPAPDEHAAGDAAQVARMNRLRTELSIERIQAALATFQDNGGAKAPAGRK